MDEEIYDRARARSARNRMPLPAAGRAALERLRRRLAACPDEDPAPCLCGATEDLELVGADRNGLPCRLVLCRACGLIRMDPQPSAAALARFYAEDYRAVYGPHGPRDAELFERMAWKGELVHGVLAAAGIAMEGATILDVGCGGGWTLRALAAAGAHGVGYDYDVDLLELGRAIAGLDLRPGGLEAAHRDGVRADVVVYAHVLEHTKDPVAALASLRPLLRRHGVLYVEVPHVRRIAETLDGDAMRYWQRAHLWDFQRPHVEVLARRAGFAPFYSGEDPLSAWIVCRPAEPRPREPLPLLGRRVEAFLRACERRRRHPRTRLRVVARAGWRGMRAAFVRIRAAARSRRGGGQIRSESPRT